MRYNAHLAPKRLGRVGQQPPPRQLLAASGRPSRSPTSGHALGERDCPPATPTTSSLIHRLDSVPAKASGPRSSSSTAAWADLFQLAGGENGHAPGRRLLGAGGRQPAGEPDHRRRIRRRLPQDDPRPDRARWPLLRGRGHHQRRHRQPQRQGPSSTSTPPLPAPGETNGQASAAPTRSWPRTPPPQLFTTTAIPRCTRRRLRALPQREHLRPQTSPTTCRPPRQRSCGHPSAEPPRRPSTPRPDGGVGRTIPSWYFISTGDQIITPTSELAMAKRAHSHITLFQGGSHLTLISHPNAVTATHRLGGLVRPPDPAPTTPRDRAPVTPTGRSVLALVSIQIRDQSVQESGTTVSTAVEGRFP